MFLIAHTRESKRTYQHNLSWTDTTVETLSGFPFNLWAGLDEWTLAATGGPAQPIIGSPLGAATGAVIPVAPFALGLLNVDQSANGQVDGRAGMCPRGEGRSWYLPVE
ncbi:unnamed protein product [Protopolystoma xenopodis]|uniref:Uncharacterized protein n=1 Tax=Protopolystoma xenopodis TaxID=117903 RepID=A0A3S5BC45_9PLAT|nr:unnamed protein product [Protopolystoma xenopodis]